MDDLAFVRGRVESYADYTNEVAGRVCDEQVRAYCGEALSRLLDRLQLTGAAADTVAAVMLRFQFVDQRVAHALDAGELPADEITALHAADRVLVTLADRAASISASGLEPYLADVRAASDSRLRIFTSVAAASPHLPPR